VADIELIHISQVLELHDLALELTGHVPLPPRLELLESALAQAQWTLVGGGDVYEIAAAYAYHIAKNHAFFDGNERTAALAAHVFLLINNVKCHPKPKEYAQAIEDVILGKLGKPELAAFFRANTVVRPTR
jgi:death on curing protein